MGIRNKISVWNTDMLQGYGISTCGRDIRIRHATEVWDFDMLDEYGKRTHKDRIYVHIRSVWVILQGHVACRP
jgi:hypothetical protein